MGSIANLFFLMMITFIFLIEHQEVCAQARWASYINS
jgi:hypothetical protein